LFLQGDEVPTEPGLYKIAERFYKLIDLHCHILPGADDGAQSLEESLSMAKTAVEDGIHTMLATAHTLNGVYINPIEQVISMVDDLQQILTRPAEYSVIATMNLNGDYISDALAAIVGGIGIAPGANINYETGHAIFEATHGTAPKYAGQDKVNPGSVILSGVMMRLGWCSASLPGWSP